MRAVIQKVTSASVVVDGTTVGAIKKGLLVFLGIKQGDTADDAAYLRKKILNLRIFDDADGKMNHSIQDVGGEILVVSQFTLYGDTRKGNRPSFIEAMPPQKAEAMYDQFVADLTVEFPKVETGTFQAMMDVHLVNDGPVTILIES